jgi:hypothetical protein
VQEGKPDERPSPDHYDYQRASRLDAKAQSR